MTAKNLGAIPAAGRADRRRPRRCSRRRRRAFATVGDLLARSRQKAAIGEAMRVVGEANKYLSDTAPWKLKNDRPRRGWQSVLHVALQVVDDAKTLLTPFLPRPRRRGARAARRRPGTWARDARAGRGRRADGGGSPSYPVLTGDYDTRRALGVARRSRSGTPLAPPTPVFTKLDPSVVDEELARLAAGAP